MTRIYWIIAVALAAGSIATTACLYPGLPDRIPTHWNIRGEIDGYGGRWTLFLLPLTTAPLLFLFYFLPALSPRHFEVDTFRTTYLYIMDVTVGLFAYMQAVLLYTVERAVYGGPSIEIGRAFFAGLFLFLALMGGVLRKVRKNFYIGIRVPWTLASDRVWDDTHRLGSWVIVVAGAVGFLVTIAGAPIAVPIVLLIGAAMIPILYSFVHYKSLERAGRLEP